MRRRLLFALCTTLALVSGVGVALLTTRTLPSGTLETEVTDVTVVAPAPPTTTTEPPAPKPPESKPDVDRRCWTMFGGGPRRELARPAIDLGIPGKKLWARGLKSYVEYPPSYCDGMLYVNTFKGDTWAIDASTGKVAWRRVTDAHKPSTPAISGDNLIVSAKDGTVTALTRKSGKVVWQLRTNAIVESSPAVVDGTAYFGATDGRLFAVDADTGHVRWAYDTGGRINSSPSLAEGRVCITTYAGSIFCVRQRDGRKLWSTYVKRDTFRYESFTRARRPTGSGSIRSRARGGSSRSTRRAAASCGPITSARSATRRRPSARTGSSSGISTAACGRTARPTGGSSWRTYVGGRILGGAVVVGDLVFFSTLETETYAARVSDGKVVWHFPIGKYSPGIATERAYYFTLNGILVAFRGRNSPA